VSKVYEDALTAAEEELAVQVSRQDAIEGRILQLDAMLDDLASLTGTPRTDPGIGRIRVNREKRLRKEKRHVRCIQRRSIRRTN